MKKTLKRLTAVLMALMMAFTLIACGADPAPSDEGGDSENANVSASGNLVMGTGGVSGTWYPVGGAICGAMTSGSMNVTVQSSGGGVENARTLLQGERDLGTIGADVTYYAYSGMGDFEGTDGSSLRVLFAFCPSQAHLAVRADANVNCFSDLKGMNCGVGATGSGDELLFRTILNLLGMTYDDVNESMTSIAEQATAFKDRRLDSMWSVVSAPNSGFLDVASQANIKLVPISGEERDTVLKQCTFLSATTLPASTYSFMTEDLETLVMNTEMVCTTNLTNEQVYTIMENMFANITDIQNTHPSMANFTIESAWNNGEHPIPMHDGAIQWFADHGFSK